MNVSIGKNLERYIELQLKNGPFNSASEIVRDALRMHQLKYSEIYREIGDKDSEEDMAKWLDDSQAEEEASRPSRKRRASK